MGILFSRHAGGFFFSVFQLPIKRPRRIYSQYFADKKISKSDKKFYSEKNQQPHHSFFFFGDGSSKESVAGRLDEGAGDRRGDRRSSDWSGAGDRLLDLLLEAGRGPGPGVGVGAGTAKRVVGA